MASPGSQHCAICVGTLSFPVELQFEIWSREPFTEHLGVNTKRRIARVEN